jgi:hypothetical protein
MARTSLFNFFFIKSRLIVLKKKPFTKEFTMSLLHFLMSIFSEWKDAFYKTSTFTLCLAHAFCGLKIMHRKTITNFIRLLGLELEDWSKHYKLYSRSPWKPEALFQPIIKRAGALGNEEYIQLAGDYTSVKKTGKHIPNTALIRDPMSPKFRHNLMLGHTFIHIAVTLPCYQVSTLAARSLPVRWQLLPKMKKPTKRSPKEKHEEYKRFLEENNRSKIFIKTLKKLREAIDKAGHKDKKLLVALDGDFCNRYVLGSDCERTDFAVRARKNLKLCFRSEEGGRRFYAKEKFTPEEIRQDKSIDWKTAQVFHSGEWREVDYKEVKGVYWQGGTKRKELRLIVIRPIPYRKTKTGRLLYRQPAYLLCTDLNLAVEKVLQAYFDRWEIEVNHREAKFFLGVGQAQLRNPNSIEKQPAQMMAAYSGLLLASILAMQHQDWHEMVEKTKWYKSQKRPSCRDLSRFLLQELEVA